MYTVANALTAEDTHTAYTVIHMLYNYVYNLWQYHVSNCMKFVIQKDCLLYTPKGIINYGTSKLLDIIIQMYIGLYCFSYIITVILFIPFINILIIVTLSYNGWPCLLVAIGYPSLHFSGLILLHRTRGAFPAIICFYIP